MTPSLHWLLDPSGFPPRWHCGEWSAGLGWLHIVSDLLIWLAYLTIPVALVWFVRRRPEVPFRLLFWLFGAFILTCGTTHLLEAVIFYEPLYRLAGVVKALTAAVSWATVFALIPAVPRALAMRSPEQLEAEVAARTMELAEGNRALEREVQRRVHTEEELREQREWFRVVLESIGEGVVATDPAERVVFLNPVAESLTEWPAADALGRSLEEVVRTANEDTRHQAESPVGRVLWEGRSIGLTNHTLLVTRSGRERIIERSATPICDGNKAVRGIVMAFRDTTEQTIAQEARARLAAIVEGSDDAIIGSQTDGTVTSWNGAAERLYGWTSGEMVGRPVSALVPPDRAEEQREMLRRVEAGERVPPFETARLRKDGSRVDVRVTLSPIRRADGELIGVSKIARDITSQKAAEAALRRHGDEMAAANAALQGEIEERLRVERELREQREWFRVVLASIGDAVVATDPQKRIAFMNPEAEALTRWRAGEAIGRPLDDVVRTVDEVTREELDGPVSRVLRDGMAIGLENHTLLIARDGTERIIDRAATPIKDAGGAIRGIVLVFRDTTERRTTEEARARLAAIVEGSADAIIGMRTDGTVTSWNQAAERLYGWAGSEIVGRPIGVLVPPERQEESQRIVRQFSHGVAVPPFETVRVRKDGSRVDVSVTVSPILGKHGAVLGGSAVARDVTDRKRADVTQAMLAAIVEHSDDAIIAESPDGVITNWNFAAERLFGHPAGEMIGKTAAPLLPPDRGDEEAYFLSRTRQGLGVSQFESRRLTKGGHTIDVSITVSPIRDRADRVIGASKIVRDITDRKLAEAAVRDALERLRGVVEQAVDAIITIDESGTIESVNPAGSRTFGYGPEEIIGHNVSILMPEPYRSRHDEFLAAYRRTGVARIIGIGREVTGRRKDGTEFPIDLSVSEVRLAGGRLFTGIVRNVSDRKRAEERLRESEATLAQAEKMAHLGAWRIDVPAPDDPGAVSVHWSDEVFRIFGYEPGSVEPTLALFLGHVPAEDRDQVAAAIRRTLACAEAYQQEHRIVRRDGEERTVYGYAEPACDPGGRPTRITGTVQDVTERTRAEEEARTLAHHVQLLLNTTSDGIYGVDAEGRCTFLNRAGAAMLQYAPDEVLGRPMHPLIHHTRPGGQPFPAAECPVHQAARDSTARAVDDWLWRKDGTPFPVTLSASPIRDRGVRGRVVTFADITERKRAEQALQEERAFLRAVLENIEEGVIACDAAGRLTLSNRAARAIHSADGGPLPAGTDDDRPPYFRTDGTTRLAPEEFPLVRALAGEQVRNAEFIIGPPEGSRRTVVGSGQPLHNPAGAKIGAVLALHDVTDQRRLEEQFRQAQKMEAVGQLAGGVAHDFNNILTVINGYSEILLAQLPPDDPSRAMLVEVARAGSRAASLTRQLLAFSRQSVLAPRVLDLNGVVADLEKMLRRVIGEDVALVTRLHPGLEKVKADPGQVEQIIMNLVVNARDAMPRGGTVTIETHNVPPDSDDLRRHPDAPKVPHVLLLVADTGVGMTPAVRARIFDPFFTTKELGKGTGLGLSMVYGAVRQSGGQVEVDSEPGQGSVFRVYFPRTETQAPSSRLSRPALSPGGGTETVLVIEDDSVVRELIRSVLQAQGYRVLAAADGDEAIHLANSFAGTIHLLATDVVMPGMGGREAAERLLVSHPQLRILFMSGYTDDAIVRHGLESNRAFFLQKPFAPVDLARRVREILDA